jgi:aminoglycoside phosphotransferase (APT) family kinase protein
MSLTAHARLRLGRSDVHGRLADYFQAGHRWLAYQSAYQPIRSWPIKPVLERTLPTLAGHVLGSTTLADTEEVTGSNPVSPTSTEHAALGNLRGDDKARLGAVVPDGTNRQGPPAQIAEEVLSGRGVDFASAVLAKGWTNATWLADEFVIRVAPTAGPADLLREAGLAACLPVQVGYPEIIDAGVLQGHEWVLMRRILGQSLSDVWSGLDWSQWASAIEQVWAKAEYVHRVDVSVAAPYVRPRSPFFSESATAGMARLYRLVSSGLLTARQVVGLGEALDRFWAALPRTSKVLNHGDLGKVNVLWHDGKVVSQVDFEFAVIGPVEIDLNEILKFAFMPPGSGGSSSDPVHGRRLAQDTAMRIAKSVLAGSCGIDILLGYSIMLESWDLENELTTASYVGDPADLKSYQLLAALAEGDGGHLAALLATL